MKLTPYKLARIKMTLPSEDVKLIEAEMAQEGGPSSRMKSMLDKLNNHFHRGKKQKGCFGKVGTNRKAQKAAKQKQIVEMLQAIRKSENDSTI